MTLTSFGRIDLEPGRVPSSRQATGADSEAFDTELQAALAAEEQQARVDARGFDRDAGLEYEEKPIEPVDADLTDGIEAGELADAGDESAATEVDGERHAAEGAVTQGVTTPAQPADEAEQPSVGTSVRTAKRFTSQSGKGADVPTDPSHSFDRSGTGASAGPVPAGAAASGSAVTTTATATSAPARADGVTPVGSSARLSSADGRARAEQAARPQAGYRSASKSAVQLDAAARDSVFRQIALRLTPEGGQMRLLLDPAEFGELDIKVRVDGKTLSLSIVADDPTVAASLERDLEGLRSAIRAQGFDVANAEIHTRQDAPDGRDPSGWENELADEFGTRPADRAGEDAETTPEPVPVRHLITADRLDFWA